MSETATGYIAIYRDVNGFYKTNGKVAQSEECARVEMDLLLYGEFVGFATKELPTKR